MTFRMKLVLIALAVEAATFGYLAVTAPRSVATRHLTHADVECRPPNTILVKPGTYDTPVDLDDLMKHCGVTVTTILQHWNDR